MSSSSINFREHKLWKVLPVLVLIALLTWLFFRSADVVPESHVNYTRLLREIQLYDEQLNSRVVATYAGLLENYDGQRHYLTQILTTLNKLKKIPSWVEDTERRILVESVEKLIQIHHTKAADVDYYQRINAIVRNSSLYLPVTTDELLAVLDPHEQPEFRDFIRRVISFDISRKADSLERSLLNQELLALKNSPQAALLQPSLQHAEILLSHSPQTLELVGKITGSEALVQLENLSKQYVSAYQKAVIEATYYQTLLYAISLMLVGYALYALFRLEKKRTDLISTHADLADRFMAQRRAEEELRLYATVFTNASEGMVITDTDTKIIAVNPAFCEITGYEAEFVIGKTPKLLNSGRQNEKFYQKMWKALNSHGQWKGEIWNSRKDGTIYPEWLSITASHNEDNLITHYIGVFTDITERKATEARIHHLAHHDILTGLPNRLLLEEKVISGIYTSKQSQHKLAIIYIDLDRFKNINDTLGHTVGDDLLMQVAQRGLNVLSQKDTFCRQGGDEFVAVIPGLESRQEAGRVCTEILTAICQPYLLAGHELTVSGSAGIAIYPEDGDNTSELLRKADVAMYRSKEIGRNTYSYFSAEISTTSLGELLLENDLFGALERDEMLLYYQPKVDCFTGELIGAEALLRWQHASKGIISPEVFIPLAEESGLINAMGEWVIRNVCAQLRQWLDDGLTILPIAINISAHQFAQHGLPTILSDILQEYQVDSKYIELEMTESLLMGNAARTTNTLQKLQNMGVEVAIDDFGTGYSSLSYLHQFPVQTLKIDRSFISQINEDGEPIKLASAIIAMAHELGLKVVAEGVETPIQAKYLQDHGCDMLQGYLYGKPQPVDEFTNLLKRLQAEN